MGQEVQTTGPLPAETVLLSTDRSIYIAGETLYLSVTVLESDNYIISDLSKVARIELLDSDGKTGIRDVLFSDKGTMAGTLKLPADLPTGWYRLRSYTSWMRNMGPSRFSYKDLRIINPADAGNLTEYILNDTLLVDIITSNGSPLTGSLNHCAVRSVTSNGRPVPIKGSLVSSTEGTVVDFTTGNTGFGILKWIPESGADYRIVLKSDPGVPVISTVPKQSASAYSVTISDPLPVDDDVAGDRNLTVTLSGDIPKAGVKLIAHRMSHWYWFSETITENPTLSFVIPTSVLPDGLIAFSFLSDDNSFLASSLWLKGDPCSGSVHVSTKTVTEENNTQFRTEFGTIENDTNKYYTLTTRRLEPVEIVDLYMPGIPGWHTTWNVPADRSEREGWLIANNYESHVAESFFREGESNPSLPQINFLDITNTRESLMEFIPETREVKLSGKVTFENGKPAGFNKLSLTGLNDNTFVTTQTFSDGRFHFSIQGRDGSKDLILSHSMRPPEKMRITISTEYDPRLAGLPPRSLYLTDSEMKYVDNLIIDSRLENIYQDSSVNTIAAGGQNPSVKGMFYGNPDRVIFIDDYIKLPDMREVIFEVVPFVNVKRKGDDFTLKVISEIPFPKIYDPLILIDGIPLLHFKSFLELPPERFERIDVINSLYIHGNQIFAGVVNFVSVNSDLAGLDLPEGSLIVTLDIPSSSPEGEMIDDDADGTEMPSFKNSLSYINLVNAADRSLTYQRKPLFGDYITILTGINKEGKWISSSSRFEIRGPYRNN